MLRTAQISILMLVMAMVATSALADPPDNYITKFVQKPLVELPFGDATNLEVYYGHDEESTAYLMGTTTLEDGTTESYYNGMFMADDFADKIDQPVVHVQWWGSYMEAAAGMNQQVKQFLISFESDIPATDAGDFSRPGDVLSSQIVTLDTAGTIPAPGSFTERWIHPGGDPLFEELFVYNAELAVPFPQEKDTIYWLKIVALVDPNEPSQEGLKWGWHNRDYTKDNLATASPVPIPGEHIQGVITDPAGNNVPIWHFQDDAVTGAVDVTVIDMADPVLGDELIQVTQDTFHETYYVPGLDMPYDIPELYSKDLAFALYAVPEPSTIVLIGMAAVCLLLTRRRIRG